MDSTSLTRPKLIVVTPVRNEAWVLDAFLTCTSSWADYIIIADQHSTDGSREIALRYPKVTLIDNPSQEWVEHQCRTRLLEEAAKIEGDKILFALDADEFLSQEFDRTKGWRHIMESSPNEIFCFNWLNLYDNFHTVAKHITHAEWAAHFGPDIDIVEEYRKREQNAVHCQRLPCLEGNRCHYTNIDDILFVHLAILNHRRTRNKLDFYQVVNIDKNHDKSNPLTMYRSYNDYYPKRLCHLESPIQLYCYGNPNDCHNLVKESDYGKHYIDEIVAILLREGYDKFNALCIWDNIDLRTAGINHTPPVLYQIFHWYLKSTQKHYHYSFIRIIDKLLKYIV